MDVKVPFKAQLRFTLFPQTTDYALRAVAHLAQYADGLSTISETAEAIKVKLCPLHSELDAALAHIEKLGSSGILVAISSEQLYLCRPQLRLDRGVAP